jgi:hypothetical protein
MELSSSRDASKSIDRVSWGDTVDMNRTLWVCVGTVSWNCEFAKWIIRDKRKPRLTKAFESDMRLHR